MRLLNVALFFLAWPALYVYDRRGRVRTRILVVCGDEVLCTTNWISSGRWALPGGGVHDREDLLQGACRELKEETGIAISQKQLDFLCEGTVNEYGLSYTYSCYTLRVSAKPRIRRQWYEIMRVRWLDHRQLTAKNAEPDTLASIRACFVR